HSKSEHHPHSLSLLESTRGTTVPTTGPPARPRAAVPPDYILPISSSTLGPSIAWITRPSFSNSRHPRRSLSRYPTQDYNPTQDYPFTPSYQILPGPLSHIVSPSLSISVTVFLSSHSYSLFVATMMSSIGSLEMVVTPRLESTGSSSTVPADPIGSRPIAPELSVSEHTLSANQAGKRKADVHESSSPTKKVRLDPHDHDGDLVNLEQSSNGVGMSAPQLAGHAEALRNFLIAKNHQHALPGNVSTQVANTAVATSSSGVSVVAFNPFMGYSFPNMLDANSGVQYYDPMGFGDLGVLPEHDGSALRIFDHIGAPDTTKGASAYAAPAITMDWAMNIDPQLGGGAVDSGPSQFVDPRDTQFYRQPHSPIQDSHAYSSVHSDASDASTETAGSANGSPGQSTAGQTSQSTAPSSPPSDIADAADAHLAANGDPGPASSRAISGKKVSAPGHKKLPPNTTPDTTGPPPKKRKRGRPKGSKNKGPRVPGGAVRAQKNKPRVYTILLADLELVKWRDDEKLKWRVCTEKYKAFGHNLTAGGIQQRHVRTKKLLNGAIGDRVFNAQYSGVWVYIENGTTPLHQMPIVPGGKAPNSGAPVAPMARDIGSGALVNGKSSGTGSDVNAGGDLRVVDNVEDESSDEEQSDAEEVAPHTEELDQQMDNFRPYDRHNGSEHVNAQSEQSESEESPESSPSDGASASSSDSEDDFEDDSADGDGETASGSDSEGNFSHPARGLAVKHIPGFAGKRVPGSRAPSYGRKSVPSALQNVKGKQRADEEVDLRPTTGCKSLSNPAWVRFLEEKIAECDSDEESDTDCPPSSPISSTGEAFSYFVHSRKWTGNKYSEWVQIEEEYNSLLNALEAAREELKVGRLIPHSSDCSEYFYRCANQNPAVEVKIIRTDKPCHRIKVKSNLVLLQPPSFPTSMRLFMVWKKTVCAETTEDYEHVFQTIGPATHRFYQSMAGANEEAGMVFLNLTTNANSMKIDEVLRHRQVHQDLADHIQELSDGSSLFKRSGTVFNDQNIRVTVWVSEEEYPTSPSTWGHA
ncbi:hypothetical protein P152DRAFT_227830, partial [Eremomyces bilateralis CBS 781.70]